MHEVFFCISKINNTLIDNAEDLDVVMPKYNLLEYSKIIQKQQEVFRMTAEMNQTVVEITPWTVQLKIQNLLITKEVLQES